MPKKYTDDQLLQLCVDSAKEKLAEDVVTLSIGSVSSIADFFVVATANSEPQLRAVADFIERKAREKFGVHTSSSTENSEGGWVLLDFGNVIVHIMTPEMRARYNLEGLWGDAEKLRRMRPELQ
jgi:ribosome-associated protein